MNHLTHIQSTQFLIFFSLLSQHVSLTFFHPFIHPSLILQLQFSAQHSHVSLITHNTLHYPLLLTHTRTNTTQASPSPHTHTHTQHSFFLLTPLHLPSHTLTLSLYTILVALLFSHRVFFTKRIVEKRLKSEHVQHPTSPILLKLVVIIKVIVICNYFNLHTKHINTCMIYIH